jgi:zinc transport system substrate-binding protein
LLRARSKIESGINQIREVCVGSRYLQVILFVFFFVFPVQLCAEPLEKIQVFVSIPPQKWLCEQLGSDHVITHLLIAKGQEPHAFDPSPRQIQALSRSSLFFTAGLAFEQEITRRLQTGAPHLQIVDTSKNINKIPMDGSGHDHGHKKVLDPHVWLSPQNLKSMATVMAVAFVHEDPDNKLVYERNLAKLNLQLDEIDQTITKELAPFQGASFFVFHPSFGYFAHRYHLQQVAVETGGKSPTPKQLFALIRKAKADGIKVVFVQPQFDRRSAESVAMAIGGKVVPLDPLAENSVENIRNMAVKIANALGGLEK